jgi:hypothetical protein
VGVDEITEWFGGRAPRRPEQLRCEECGWVSQGPAWGWRGHRVDIEQDGPPEVLVVCPICSAEQSDER